MKGKIFIWISLIIVGFVSCEKSEEIKIDSIVDTKWKLTQIIDKSGEISNFPSDIDDFEIVFRKSGKIDLTNLCNYSFGEYTLNTADSIEIYNVGAGTEKYCLPDKSMDWETNFINSLILSKTYSIADNKLTIDCQDNKLVFDFETTYDSNIGKALFCTNAHMMDCIFSIDITIDGKKIGTLDASSTYSDNDCYCENSTGIGLLISKDKGKYTYSAKETECNATNITNSWTGELTVVGDSCTMIFLDIFND
jgi:heat shock protein HslJ